MSSEERVKQIYPNSVAKVYIDKKGFKMWGIKIEEQSHFIGVGKNSTVAWWDALKKINIKLEVKNLGSV
jgi:hypothetical protein